MNRCPPIMTLPRTSLIRLFNGNVDDFQARALQNRPDLRAAQQGITAANSQFRAAEGHRETRYYRADELHAYPVQRQFRFSARSNCRFSIAIRAKLRAHGYAMTQAQEQEKSTQGQVLTDVRDAYENLHTNDEIVGLYRSGYLDEAQQDRDISEYAYRRGAASLLDFLDAERSYRSVQLGYRQSLASYLLAAGAAARSGGNQEPTMTITQRSFAIEVPGLRRIGLHPRHHRLQFGRSGARRQMTSFSARASSSETPRLFTIPEDQMSHVQVVTVQADQADADAAADGRGRLQRIQHHTGDHARWAGR